MGTSTIACSGTMDAFRVNVPTHGPDKYVVHNYQALHDKDGNYAGVNEYILDFKPIIDWYLAQTGQKLIGDVDAVSSASVKDHHSDDVDAGTSASVKACYLRRNAFHLQKQNLYQKDLIL